MNTAPSRKTFIFIKSSQSRTRYSLTQHVSDQEDAGGWGSHYEATGGERPEVGSEGRQESKHIHDNDWDHEGGLTSKPEGVGKYNDKHIHDNDGALPRDCKKNSQLKPKIKPENWQLIDQNLNINPRKLDNSELIDQTLNVKRQIKLGIRS